MIFLSVLLAIECAVSFRAVPKILKNLVVQTNICNQIKVPHYTTVIRWVCRIGYYLIKRPNKKVCSSKKPWICIADHTIQVGTNKAFAVIGVPAAKMEQGRALTLKDVTVLSVVVKKSWTGTAIRKVLERIFKRNGFPVQIVIDGASNLKKGVREVSEAMDHEFHVTYDITHLIANLLKKRYEGSMNFHRVMKELSITSKRITQSDIGYLLPPKIREKARFLNLPSLARWFEKMLDILTLETLRPKEKRQIKKQFGWIWKPGWESYIREFVVEVKAVTEVQKLLKNTGINDFSYKMAVSKLSGIDDSEFTTPIISSLLTELDYSKQTGFSMLMTSDIIESLFGKYKAIVKPHRQSEINKSVLSMPVVCEEITPDLVDKIFSKVTGTEMDRWVKRNIPTTLLSRRKVVMGPHKKPTKVFDLIDKIKNKITSVESGQFNGGSLTYLNHQNASP